MVADFLVRFSLNTVPDLGGCWGLGFLVVAGVLLSFFLVFFLQGVEGVLDHVCVLGGWGGGGGGGNICNQEHCG